MRLWAATVALLLGAGSALALDDLVTQRGVLVDPTGTLTVEQVAQRKDFRPVTGPVSRGYTTAATWLRIEVAPTLQGQVVVVVQPAYLDDLRLYSPRERVAQPTGFLLTGTVARPSAGIGVEAFGTAGAATDSNVTDADSAEWLEQRSGDQMALSAKRLKSVYPTFIVPSRADRPTVHYLRLQTTSVSLLHVKALSLSDQMTFDTAIHSAVSAYVGLILVLAGFAFVCWRITRDRIWALDSAFQVVTVVFTLSIMGIGGRYWFAEWPEAADLSTSVMSVSQVAIAGWFFWRLFAAYGAPGWTTWLYRGSLLLFPVMIGLIWLGDPRTAVSINSNLILLQTLVGMVIIWFVPIQDRIQRVLLRFVYISLTVYLLYFILPLLGLAKPTEFNLYPALGSNLFSGLMVQAVLWRRTHLQIRERNTLRLQLEASKQSTQYEAARRAESANLLGMLVHEIKNPLASIAIASKTLSKALPANGSTPGAAAPDAVSMSEQQLRFIQNAVQGIDAVLERCVDADRLEQGALRVHTQPHDVAQLLADWVSTEPEVHRIRLALAAPLPAQVDAPLLCLMVRNLLNNALKYSPEGSEVWLTLAPTGNTGAGKTGDAPSGRPGFLLKVANAVGKAGVPDPERLFQKYYRAPHAQRQTGTGLGLYWVHGVAQLLGGWVAHRFVAGDPLPVVFELWLPAGPADNTGTLETRT
ncbi:MAG: 7TM-DISM domain-containing protein [Pseudomonadota bacterium]